MSMLIIADDLSGAADCAIGFACAGYRTVVTLDAAQPFPADVIAADIDTRRLAPAQAGERAAAVWQTFRQPGRRLYKKIDSTLRGNWAAEVAALQPLAGLAIVAPAFPATGRTVLGGQLFVHGNPLVTTDTWQLEHANRCADPRAMLAEAGLTTALVDLPTLREGSDALAARIARIAADGTQTLIVDAETAGDLLTLARATAPLNDRLFWVGSGGLARELASMPGLFDGSARADAARPAPRAAHGAPVLVMVGSLSAVAERQCAVLREQGNVRELIVPPAVLRLCERHTDWPVWQTRIAAALGARVDLLLRIGRDDAFDPVEGALLSAALAALAQPHFAALGGLVVTGGETARAMLGAIGIGNLELVAEIEAGVALGQPLGAGAPAHLRVVTKAGAFGTDHALYAAWRYLHEPPGGGAVSRQSA
ncbi:four-carbon acid sugar kinase family protein [Paraburkholderia sp. IW21]|uniref:four-carbon acid sugar kinase family protein n=1 Tax=Paraburkholderia sp. IW21 TaxID=3242488 RepID=UPI003521CF52